MWRTSYKGVRKTDKAIRRQWNTCRAAGTEGQREEVVFPDPRCSLQAGSREEGAACWELEPQRWCRCSQRRQRKQREQREKFPEASLLSSSDTMSVPHLRQTDSEARQAGEPGTESAVVNAEMHREQWRAEQWVLEQEGNDSHTWESLLALGARRFPLMQLKPFLFFWGSGFWNSKSGRDSFLWISSKTNRESARAGEKCKKLKTHGSYFSNATPSPVLLRDHCQEAQGPVAYSNSLLTELPITASQDPNLFFTCEKSHVKFTHTTVTFNGHQNGQISYFSSDR